MAEINSQFDHFLTESFEAVSQSSQYDSTRICQNTEQIEHDQLKRNYTFWKGNFGKLSVVSKYEPVRAESFPM